MRNMQIGLENETVWTNGHDTHKAACLLLKGRFIKYSVHQQLTLEQPNMSTEIDEIMP